MKDIQFEAVGLKNFGGYNEEIVLEFETGKLILITGPNGVGKTTFFDAMSYALYGRTTKGGTGEDVINNVAKKNCRCWVDLSIDGEKYSVDRYVKYTKHGTTVHLKKDNEVIKKGHKEVVPYIEQIFMPYKLFMNTLMFAQKVEDFFTDLTDSQQKEIFRKILLLDEYVAYTQTASDKLKVIDKMIVDLTTQLDINDTIIGRSKSQIKELEIKKDQFAKERQEKLSSIVSDIHETNIYIDKHKDILSNYDKSLDDQKIQLSNHLTTIESQIDSINSDVEKALDLINTKKELKQKELSGVCNEKVNEANNIYTNIKTTCTNRLNDVKLETQKQKTLVSDEYNDKTVEAIKLESEIEAQKIKMEEYSEAIKLDSGSTCPTCRQVLDENAIQQITNDIGELNTAINVLTDQRQTILHTASTIRISKLDRIDEILVKETKQYNDEVKEAEKQYNEQCSDIKTRLNDVIGKLNGMAEGEIKKTTQDGIQKRKDLELDKTNLTTNLTNVNNLITERDKVVVEISRLENELRVLDDRHTEAEDSKFDDSMITNLKDDIKKVRAKIKQDKETLNELEFKRNITQFWKKDGFSSAGIPSMLIDESIPFMNQTVSKYSEQIAGGRYVISFDTLKANKDGKEFKDKINVEVYDSLTKSDKRVKFSGGQTRIVDIATILTLRELQSKFQDMKINLLLFDEIFDSLDDENITYIAKLLQSLTKDLCIILISHRHFDSIEADEVLRLET